MNGLNEFMEELRHFGSIQHSLHSSCHPESNLCHSATLRIPIILFSLVQVAVKQAIDDHSRYQLLSEGHT